jgi:hypothetical protein
MADSNQLLQRNKDLEATCAHEEASIIARHQVYVITFLDPRTDSSAFLELDLGDAMEVRNAGGRVSADVLGDLPAPDTWPARRYQVGRSSRSPCAHRPRRRRAPALSHRPANTTSISGRVYEVTTGLANQESE